MKQIYILIIFLLFISCEIQPVDNTQYEIEYEEIYCPKCNGSGVVEMSTTDRIVLGILSFGPGAMCDTEECEMCKGTRIIKRHKLK